ncbi:MAG: hypothetical protein KBT06_05640, partial [Prevotellaceae bacterium]|nr:hypothetical protein [Candidatus Colivivens equi]
KSFSREVTSVTFITNLRFPSMFRRMAPSGNSLYGKISPDSNDAYYKSAPRCPYCGEEKVCGTADMVTAWICELSLEFGSEIAVQIDNYPITKASKLKISYAQHTHRTGYWIVDLPVFDYRSTIRIGNMSFTGKEFIKWIDTIASMGIKKMNLFW